MGSDFDYEDGFSTQGSERDIPRLVLPEERLAAYRCAIMEVETKFRIFNEEFRARDGYSPVEFLKSRVKSPESIAEKLVRKGLPVDANIVEDAIDDIAGVRVVCHFKSDVYTLGDALLRQGYIDFLEKLDYIANPKPNGYRALHLVIRIPVHMREQTERVKVEVQFMTLSMNTWATLEHKIFYKKDVGRLEDEFAPELAVCSRLSAEIDERMEKMAQRVLKGI